MPDEERQYYYKTEIDSILRNQIQLGMDMKEAIDGLNKLIVADTEVRKDVEQGKKEITILFGKTRTLESAVTALEIRNAVCDGANIFTNFPKIWNWYQSEMGWRRFIPAAITVLCFLLLVLDRVK